MRKIAVEEHFYTSDYVAHLQSRKTPPRLEFSEDENHIQKEYMFWNDSIDRMTQSPILTGALLEVGETRLREMDETGIDMQVLSLSAPGVEQFDAAEGTGVARKANDELGRLVKKYPERFAGLAAIAPQDPAAAADELERAVNELGLKGAVVNAHVRGDYLDNRKYWPIFQKAEELNAPVYIHPSIPAPDMMRPYLPYPEMAFALWGFASDTGLHAMCLIASGVFDSYPGLKIMLGHLGEALPFWLWRMDNHWLKMKERDIVRDPLGRKLKKIPSEYIKDNFLITTSGMFWGPTLEYVHSVIGADRLLFAVDYPYESNRDGVAAVEAMSVGDADKEKIFHLNAEKFLGL